MKNLILTISLLTLLPSCGVLCSSDESICFNDEGTTGDEGGGWLCTVIESVKVCTRASIDNPTIDAAIEAGAFSVYSEDDWCENPSQPWLDYVRYSGGFSGVEFVTCGTQIQAPQLCLPDYSHQAWSREGLIGAVAVRQDPQQANCDELPALDLFFPYGNVHLPCSEGITCMERGRECSCSCEQSGWCDDMADLVESVYLGPGFLVDNALELSCSGYPWEWVTPPGQWEGTSCEFGQEHPQGQQPQP